MVDVLGQAYGEDAGPGSAVVGADGGVKLRLIAHAGFAAAGSRGRPRWAANHYHRRQNDDDDQQSG